mgnify:FL=1|tara:strand:+ start:2504 stop:2686 length:183 start_codon:yes stop_codon:yes gene_type:complete
MTISNTDRDRMVHINFIMTEIHDHSNAIYEHLVDSEYKEAKKNISELMLLLTTLDESIKK